MIYQSLCTSFKAELFRAVHDADNDTFKLALYDNTADLTSATTAYTATGEIADNGIYTTGGVVLTPTIVTVGVNVVLDFADVTLSNAGITAYGGLVYNTSKSNKAVCVLDFGGPRGSNPDFVVRFPLPNLLSGFIKI